MRVLITGGAGFIGSHLVDYLIAKNSQILVLDNFSGLSDGNLNRAKLGEIIFNQPEERYWVERVIHPYVRNCFDQAIIKLTKDDFVEEADSLLEATVHWLRHTGISDDVKIRT